MSAPTPPVPESKPVEPEKKEAGPAATKKEAGPAQPPLEQVRRVSSYERRADPRYPYAGSATPITVQIAPGETCSVRVLDVSAGGVAIETDRRLEQGTLLSIEVPTKDMFGKTRLVASVASAAPLPSGMWKLGCTFSRKLTPSELLAIL